MGTVMDILLLVLLLWNIGLTSYLAWRLRSPRTVETLAAVHAPFAEEERRAVEDDGEPITRWHVMHGGRALLRARLQARQGGR